MGSCTLTRFEELDRVARWIIAKYCRPPGPLSGLLRRRAPVASSRAIASFRSAASITNRRQPPGCGTDPSFSFFDAEVSGPLSHSDRPLRFMMSNGGPQRSESLKPRAR